MMNDLAFDEYDLISSICRESFYEFVKEFWDVVVTERPVWNWHIPLICKELQKIAERVFLSLPKDYDLIINISPGSTKSTICSVMFPAWIWTRMPTASIIAGSFKYGLSMKLSLKCRDIVLSDSYQAAFPDVRLRDDQKAKSDFMNTKNGERMTTSVDGGIQGDHGHFIIIDDPLDPRKAASDAELESANYWMDATLSTRKKNKSVTPTILIMQRLHQDDCSASMIEMIKKTQRIEIDDGNIDAPLKLKHICLPAEKSKDIRPKYLRKYYKDSLMDVKRLSNSVLNEFRAKGDYFYASQFMQNPIPEGGGMFKTDRIVIDIPDMTKMVQIVRFWDKAGTAGGGAFTAGIKLGVDVKKRFWILDVQRGQWSSEVRENNIKQTAEMDGKKVEVGIEQEPGSGGKESAEMTVKNLAGWIVRVDKPSGSGSSKQLRAAPFSVQVNMGNVSMVRGDWNAALISELRFWPNSKYKDQGDGCSGAFNMLTSKKRAGVFL